MRDFGQVRCGFWTNPEIQGLSDDGKLLALYLLTGPHSNGLGCYRLPDGYISSDLGWSTQRISKGFDELFRNGFARRCETTLFVLMEGFLRWNPIANPNQGKKRFDELMIVPKESSVYWPLIESMKRFGNHLPKDFETVSKQERRGEDTERTVSERVSETRSSASPADVSAKPTPEKQGKTKSTKAPLPSGWQPSAETVQALSAEFGWREGDAERYVQAFADACRAKDYRYVDFDAAFRNCVRQDWPQLRKGKPAGDESWRANARMVNG